VHPLINSLIPLGGNWIGSQTYELRYIITAYPETIHNVYLQIKDCENLFGTRQELYVAGRPFYIDKQKPTIVSLTQNLTLVNDASTANGLELTLTYNEACNTSLSPQINFNAGASLAGTISLNTNLSVWINNTTYKAVYDLFDNNEIIPAIDVVIASAMDTAGNEMSSVQYDALLAIDTRNPVLLNYTQNTASLNLLSIGSQAFEVTLEFDKAMNTAASPVMTFPQLSGMGNVLVSNIIHTQWLDSSSCKLSFNLQNVNIEVMNISGNLSLLMDNSGNPPSQITLNSLLNIDTKRPEHIQSLPNSPFISDMNVGSGTFTIYTVFDEVMDISIKPILSLQSNGNTIVDVMYNVFNSNWANDTMFIAVFNVNDLDNEINNLTLQVNFARDLAGNAQQISITDNILPLDTRNPRLISMLSNTYNLTSAQSHFEIIGVFDETIDNTIQPVFDFVSHPGVNSFLVNDATNSGWINPFTYRQRYTVMPMAYIENNISIKPLNLFDMAGNPLRDTIYQNYFSIDYEPTTLVEYTMEGGEIMLYPNPNDGGLLTISSDESLKQIAIFGFDGRIVHEQLVSGKQIRMDIGFLNAGIYLVRAISDDGFRDKKLIVIK
jgi:hypothetical protein